MKKKQMSNEYFTTIKTFSKTNLSKRSLHGGEAELHATCDTTQKIENVKKLDVL